MGWPSEFNISGVFYSITYCKGPLEVDPDGAEVVLGHTDINKKEIRIFKSKNQIEMFSTLLHELVHAMIGENKMLSDHLENKGEEALVSQFETTLCDTLVRNRFMRWMRER